MRRPLLHGLMVALLAGVIGFTNLGNFSGSTGDEAIHIAVTLEMMQTGNYLVPTLGLEPYFNKPPLKMWASMVPIALLGPSNWSFRILDALGGVVTALLLWWFTSKLTRSSIAGIVAAAGLLSCDAYVFNHGIRNAVQDSWLVMLTTAAVVCGGGLLLELSQGSVTFRRRMILALCTGGTIGCALLVKSVAGIISLPILGVFALCGPLQRNFREVVSSGLVVLGAAGAVTLLYYLPVYLTYPELFAQAFQREIVQRAEEGFHNQNQPWYYGEQLLSLRYLDPFLLVVALGLTLLQIRQHLAARLALCWAAIPVILYSALPSRLEWYIAPALPGMALCLALALQSLWQISFTDSAKLKNLRIALAKMLCIGCTILLIYDVGQVVRRVNLPKKRSAFDLLTEELRRAKALPNDQTLVLAAPDFEPRYTELPYFVALRPYLSNISLEEALKQVPPKRLILFTSREKFEELKHLPFQRLLVLRRDAERKRNMVVVQLG